MEETKKLLNEILDETLAYYDSEDKLARSNSNACYYLDTKTGNQCSVGRYFTKEIVELLKFRLENLELKLGKPKKLSNGYLVDDLYEAIHGDVHDFEAVMPLDSVLIDRVRGVSIKFWNELQQLHDSILFKYQPASRIGTKRFVNGIREDIIKGKYEES